MISKVVKKKVAKKKVVKKKVAKKKVVKKKVVKKKVAKKKVVRKEMDLNGACLFSMYTSNSISKEPLTVVRKIIKELKQIGITENKTGDWPTEIKNKLNRPCRPNVAFDPFSGSFLSAMVLISIGHFTNKALDVLWKRVSKSLTAKFFTHTSDFILRICIKENKCFVIIRIKARNQKEVDRIKNKIVPTIIALAIKWVTDHGWSHKYLIYNINGKIFNHVPLLSNIYSDKYKDSSNRKPIKHKGHRINQLK